MYGWGCVVLVCMTGMENSSSATSTTTTVSAADKGMSSESVKRCGGFLKGVGTSDTIPPQFEAKELFSDFIRGLLKVDRIERGRVSCNVYGGLHGGAVASVAEMVSIACARTVVGKDKELFLGELGISYLSAAPRNAELNVNASVVRSGRNLTVIAVEFKVKDSERLAYTSRATFYNMPVASL
ncbi:hypothetical protein TEA_025909 [Camellia sinensis var. sinensis]|uniref:Thioesterase domain-containing protein n=1 Tax=Camellia sinensis var. sinensis TaxID=542762 RepID=A0A4S4DEN3_CAMSN|nr:hypothetical protein TEA_025909 [Camellia sinensis var. sinensis]